MDFWWLICISFITYVCLYLYEVVLRWRLWWNVTPVTGKAPPLKILAPSPPHFLEKLSTDAPEEIGFHAINIAFENNRRQNAKLWSYPTVWHEVGAFHAFAPPVHGCQRKSDFSPSIPAQTVWTLLFTGNSFTEGTSHTSVDDTMRGGGFVLLLSV